MELRPIGCSGYAQWPSHFEDCGMHACIAMHAGQLMKCAMRVQVLFFSSICQTTRRKQAMCAGRAKGCGKSGRSANGLPLGAITEILFLLQV